MRVALSKATFESEIVSRFGAAFNQQKPPAEVMSTGIAEVDSMMGGLPRGAVTEIFGPPSSGRTSFMFSSLAHATHHDEVCVLVDTSDCFDPATAVAAGVDLDRLLWVRCASNVEHAFKATDLLLQGGGFGLVLLDLGDIAGKDARRIISSWWYRFRRTVENTPTSFLVIGQESSARSCASLTLEIKKESEVWASVISGPSLVNCQPLRSFSKSPSVNRHNLSSQINTQLFQGSHLYIQQHRPNKLRQIEARVYAQNSFKETLEPR